jgi:hypothetical protein
VVYHGILYVTEFSLIACYFYLGSVSILIPESPLRIHTHYNITHLYVVCALSASRVLP